MRVKRNAEEDALQAQVIELLVVAAVPGLIYFAVPNGGYRDPQTARTLKLTGVRPGVSDIALIKDRFPHFLEMKTKKGRQSADQEKFEADCIAQGIPYRIARSRDEAQDILTEWGMLRIRKAHQ